MKNTKKGITLVELIICCFILVLVAGACISLLASGQHLFNKGSNAVSSKMNNALLQEMFIAQLPKTKSVSTDSRSVAAISENCSIYFDSEGVFCFRAGQKSTSIHDITQFECTFSKIGEGEKAKTLFSYSATTKDGTTYDGGLSLSLATYIGETERTSYTLKNPKSDAVLPGTAVEAIIFKS